MLRVMTIALCAAALGLSFGCKKDDAEGKDEKPKLTPAELCETIFEDRINGHIRPFKEQGPKHKAEFMEFCPTLPEEYLECEAEDLMSMSESRMETCGKLLREGHQDKLNNVLVTGKPDA